MVSWSDSYYLLFEIVDKIKISSNTYPKVVYRTRVIIFIRFAFLFLLQNFAAILTKKVNYYRLVYGLEFQPFVVG